MKLKYLFIFVIVACFGIYICVRHDFSKHEEVKVDSLDYYYAQTIKGANALHKQVDSLKKLVNRTDTVILKEKIYVKAKAQGAYALHSDSSYLLFLRWTSEFKDSTFRARYFTIGSTTIN